MNKFLDDTNIISKKDPRSIYYERKLFYPKVNWIGLFFEFLFFIFLSSVLTITLLYFQIKVYIIILCNFGYLLLYLLIRSKAFILFLIDLYQLLAPKKIRMRCRFEPSCSEYMKLAIKKYGLIKGFKKGIKRLKSCKAPNGGYDYP